MKKSKICYQKICSIVAVLSIVMVCLLNGILAYLKDTDVAENVFTIGEVNIEIIEKTSGTAGGNDEVFWSDTISNIIGTDGSGNVISTKGLAKIRPGQEIAKQPYIKNVGNNNAYVYMSIGIPIVDFNGVSSELFTYSVNSGWTLKGSYKKTENGLNYKIYNYQYESELEPSQITSTIFDSVKVINTDITPDDLAKYGNMHKILVKAYGIQSEDITLAQGYNRFFDFYVKNITQANYGQYVDLNTSIIDLNSSTFEDNTHPKSDWRVILKDENGAWLILSDYLPNSKFNVTTVGLESGNNDYSTYGVSSTTNRISLINGLDDDWSGLISGSSIENISGIQVKGALTLEQWVNSWNSNRGYTKVYTALSDSEMSDGQKGYCLGDTENPTSEYCDVSNNTGFNDVLYFPHKSIVNSCYGYWLNSYSANGPEYVMCILRSGRVNCGSYNIFYRAVRPVVYLPSDVKLNTNGDVWTIEN